MDTKEIKELLKAFDESGSSYFQIKQDGVEIKFKKPAEKQTFMVSSDVPLPNNVIEMPQPKVQTQETKQEEEQPDGELVLAPLVGVFYSAPSPEDSPYVQVGDRVKEGQVLCLIEAMKMMSEITAPKDGLIKAIYAKNQDVVGFEDQLFLIGD